MKKFRKISALILTLALLASSLMTGGIVGSAESSVTLPETDTEVNAVGSWDNWYNAAHAMAFEQSGIEYVDAANGIVRKTAAEAYVVYRVEKNSPFIADFLIYREHTNASPVFYVSPDGVNYTEYEMTSVTAGDNFTYYTNGIGENNKYVKIVVSDTESTHWMVDLRKVSYIANTEEQVAPDTTLDFLSNFSVCTTKANTPSLIEKHNIANYGGVGLVGTNTPDAYIVYKVQDNSPIKAKFKLTATARPAFYASPDGISWTEIRMQRTDLGSQFYEYYRDGIGIGNRYFKIQVSTTQLGGSGGNLWEVDLHTLSFNANTDERASFDTTFDFVSNDYVATSNAYATSNISKNDVSGYISASGMDGYIVYKVAKNSPIYANFLQYDGFAPVFYASEDAESWTEINMEVTVDGNNQYHYRDCIGANNKYVKIVLASATEAYWKSDIQNFSCNLFTATDTVIDCDASWDAWYNAAYKVAFDRAGIIFADDNGILGNDIPNSYVTYKVQDNSPVKADFKWQHNVAEAKPLFYASADGIEWTALTMDVYKKGITHIYHIDGIGEGNRYVKIVLSDTAPDAIWRCNLREVCYNANTVDTLENEAFDNVLNFVGEYNTVFAPAAGKATATSEIQQNVDGDGNPLGVIGIKAEQSYLVYEVEKNSAFSAYFKVQSAEFIPVFYASADGVEWTKLAVEKSADTGLVTYYRDCIGADNKYVKIVLSTVEDAHWQSELRSFSYYLIDASGDGKTRADDLVWVRKQLIGTESGCVIDYNRDGKEDILDLVRLKKALVNQL